MSSSVQFGRTRISYDLVRRERSTLLIEVHPDKTVLAVAPINTDLASIDEKMLKRAPWILKQQQEFDQFRPVLPAYAFFSGEAFRYIGRQCRLKLRKAKNECVRLQRGELIVSLINRDDREKIRQLLQAWFLERADSVISELWVKCVRRMQVYGIEPKGFRLRKMRTRWGSCQKNGTVLLNPELICAPKPASSI